MPSAARSSSRTAVSLLIGVSLLSWAITGYAFIQRDDAGAKLAQTEAARASLASDIEHAKADTGQVADLQQKLAAAQADLAKSQASATEASQQVTTLAADLATRTHERDVLKGQLQAAQASLAAAGSHAAPETHAAPAPKPQTHK